MVIKKDLFDFIKREGVETGYISELKACFDMLGDGLMGLKSNLLSKLPQLAKNNEYKKMEEYIQFFKEIDEYVSQIQATKKTLETVLPQGNPSITKVSAETPPLFQHSAELKTIYLFILDEERSCPICKKELAAHELSYCIYFDVEHQKLKETQAIGAKKCASCKKLFLNRRDVTRIDSATGLAYTNLICKELARRKETCKFFGCQATELYRDGLCKDHYRHEYYESR
jgi:hypothetical protein